jgi:dihydroorotase
MRRAFLLLVLGAGVAQALSCGPRHEVAITNVRCLRGDRVTDDACAVGIDGGRITYVGARTPRAHRRVDGEGGILAPGFIDTNVPGFVGPGAGSDVKLLDGVTTYLSAHGGLPVTRPHAAARRASSTTRPPSASPARASVVRVRTFSALSTMGCAPARTACRCHRSTTPLSSHRTSCGRCARASVRVAFPIAFHTRYSALDRELDGVREAIACAQSGAPVHLLHLASTGGTHHPSEAIALVEDARRAGLTVLFDFYPYTSWASSIQRARFEGDWLARYAVGWDRVRVPGSSGTLDAERFDALRRSGRHWVVMVDAIPEATVDYFARATDAPIGTDSAPSEGRLAHPRGAGSFMRFLHRYGGTPTGSARRSPAFRRTCASASRPGSRRSRSGGRVEVGYAADLVVLDPTTIGDHATSDAPLAPSTGVVAALVNGRVVVENRRPVPGVRDTGRWFRGRFTAAD